MKKHIYLYLLVALCLLNSFSLAQSNASMDQLKDLKFAIESRINLINRIIVYHSEACMKNWVLLGNPHDETEIMFYMNSISNGSKSAYESNSLTMKKTVNHSRTISGNELSIVLQHLRLSLMAYNVRPGSEAPSFIFKSFEKVSANEAVAHCDFKFNNASGRTVLKAAQILYSVGDNPVKDMFLYKIYIEDHLVYGWWY